MGDYISRDMAIARLTKVEVTENLATMTDAKRVIADMPAADVAPVVRCTDCKYWGDEHGIAQRDDGAIYARCRLHNHDVGGEQVGWVSTEADFCSCGQRKEETND